MVAIEELIALMKDSVGKKRKLPPTNVTKSSEASSKPTVGLNNISSKREKIEKSNEKLKNKTDKSQQDKSSKKELNNVKKEISSKGTTKVQSEPSSSQSTATSSSSVTSDIKLKMKELSNSLDEYLKLSLGNRNSKHQEMMQLLLSAMTLSITADSLQAQPDIVRKLKLLSKEKGKGAVGMDEIVSSVSAQVFIYIYLICNYL